MIVDIRTYTFQAGKMQPWLKVYEEFAWPLQQKYLGDCLGFYTTIEGTLNRVVHIWRYESQADREARRGAMMQDPGWAVFQEQVARLEGILSQTNVIARAAPFYTAR